jgi:Family of unknown function (DUF5713)
MWLRLRVVRDLVTRPYFPDHVVDKGKAILLGLCERTGAERPGGLAALHALTGVATEEFNASADEFDAAGS